MTLLPHNGPFLGSSERILPVQILRKTTIPGSACILTAIEGCSWEIGPTAIGAESRTGIVGDNIAISTHLVESDISNRSL